ncbi:hypothetical protein DLE60_18540, partial [Micromonospora globispora]
MVGLAGASRSPFVAPPAPDSQEAAYARQAQSEEVPQAVIEALPGGVDPAGSGCPDGGTGRAGRPAGGPAGGG